MFLKWVENGGLVGFKLAPWDRFGSSPFRFEGDGGGGGGSGDGGGDGDGDGDGGGTGGDGGDPNVLPQFSQVQVNAMLAKEKSKHKGEMTKQIENLETLRQEKGLSDKQRTALSTQISELQESLMTAEQKSDAEKLRLAKEHKDQLTTAESKADANWGLYMQTKKDVAIAAAGTKHGAFRVEQLSAIVAPKAELVPVKDDQDNVVEWNVIVKKVKHKDKDGKEVEGDLSIDKYVELLKADENYANLFVSAKPGGTGYRPGSGTGGPAGPDMTPTQKIAAGLTRRA